MHRHGPWPAKGDPLKFKLFGVFVFTAVLAAFVWRMLGSPGLEASAPAATPLATSAPASTKANGASLASSAPAAATPAWRPLQAASARFTLSTEVTNARAYKAIYDRLVDSAEGQTPEGQYALYRILATCATVTNRRGPAPRQPTEEERRLFQQSLPDSDPAKSRRVAAFENLAEDKCVGLTGITLSQAELTQKLKDAAAAGSPGAQTALVEQDMLVDWRSTRSRQPTLSDTQLDTLRGALASQDPDAIANAGRILGQNFRDLTVRIGPDQLNVDPHALRIASTIAACDYGYPCGENNQRLLEACAYRGHCASGNLPDYINYYESSPNDLQLQAQYRLALQSAINSGDWSAFTFVRGPTLAGPWRAPIRR